MAQLRPYQDLFSRHKIAVLLVTFERPEIARQYVQQTDLPWPLLLDPEHTLYRAYGMERASWRRLLSWNTWKRYASLLWKGRRLHRNTGDVRQLGGDVIIDPQAVVQYVYASANPADRPPIETLLQVLGLPSSSSSSTSENGSDSKPL